MSGAATIPVNTTRLSVAGCPVDSISFDDTVRQLDGRMKSGVQTHVVGVNAANIVKYHRDSALRSAVNSADFVLADGVPVVWASQLLGRSLPGRVNGTDLMERMVALAAERGYRVFFLGAVQEVVGRAVLEFQRRHPNLKVAGYRDGYFRTEEEYSVIEQINASRADLLLVGMSTPQKELFVDRHRAHLNVAVAQGVGGSFDVIAGLVRRAPIWMQHCGLEWLWRLLQEPRRLWYRYLTTNCVFVWFVFRDIYRQCLGAMHFY